MDERTKKLVAQLKKVKAEKGLSYQDVVDLCEADGSYVSLSTVKRILGPGSENMSFRYDTTLQPIARTLLGLTDSNQEQQDSESECEALRSVVELKNEMIRQLQDGMASKEDQLARVRENSESRLQEKDKKVEYLKDEIAQLKKAAKLRTIAIVILGILLVLSMATSITYLYWDLTHPTQGAFQWGTSEYVEETE